MLQHDSTQNIWRQRPGRIHAFLQTVFIPLTLSSAGAALVVIAGWLIGIPDGWLWVIGLGYPLLSTVFYWGGKFYMDDWNYSRFRGYTAYSLLVVDILIAIVLIIGYSI